MHASIFCVLHGTLTSLWQAFDMAHFSVWPLTFSISLRSSQGPTVSVFILPRIRRILRISYSCFCPVARCSRTPKSTRNGRPEAGEQECPDGAQMGCRQMACRQMVRGKARWTNTGKWSLKRKNSDHTITCVTCDIYIYIYIWERGHLVTWPWFWFVQL